MSKLIAISILFMSSIAMACPGGHVKQLAKGERILAEININTNRIRVVDPKTELLTVLWTPGGAEVAQVVCGVESDLIGMCDYDQGLGDVVLNNDPDGVLGVQLKVGRKTYQFQVTNFRRSRAFCGGVTQPTP